MTPLDEKSPKSGKEHGFFNFVWISLGLIILVIVPFVFFGDRLEHMFLADDVVEILRSYDSFAWAVAISLLAADLVLPIPASAIMASLGMVYGPLTGGVIAAAGSFFSGLLGYVLCRYIGRPFAISIGGVNGVEKGEAIFLKSGGWLVVFSRWIPVLSEVVACLAGISKMPFTTFVIALLCGSIPLGFIYAALGNWGLEYPTATLLLCFALPGFLWIITNPLINRLSKKI